MSIEKGYFVSGIQPPVVMAEQENTLIKDFGSVIFLIASSWAVKSARKELRASLSRVRGNLKSKDLKQKVAYWFLFEKLLECVIDEQKQGLGSDVKKVIPQSYKFKSGWSTFSTFASWKMKELDIVRVTSSSQMSEQVISTSNSGITPRRSRVTKSQIERYVADYCDERADTTVNGKTVATQTAQENPRFDPRLSVHKHFCDCISRNSHKGLMQFAGDVRRDYESRYWSTDKMFYLGLPFKVKLELCIFFLLRVNQDLKVFSQDVDNGTDPIFREIISEIRRYELRDKLLIMKPDEKKELVKRLIDAVVFDFSYDIDSLMTIGATAGTTYEKRINKCVKRGVKVSFAKVKNTFTANSEDEFYKRSKSMLNTWTRQVLVEVNKYKTSFGNQGTVMDVMKSPYCKEDGGKVITLLLNSLSIREIDGFSEIVVRQRNNILKVIPDILDKYFHTPKVWEVAIPIEKWIAKDDTKAKLKSFTTLDRVQRKWKRNWAGKITNLTQTKGNNICFFCSDVTAINQAEAARLATDIFSKHLDSLWFLNDRNTSANLLNECWLKEVGGKTININHSSNNDLFDWKVFNQKKLDELADLNTQLEERWCDKKQEDIWRRLSEGIGFLKSSLESQKYYEKYLFLWMALETVFSNLDSDTSKYEQLVSIGARVSFRAALILVPDKEMVGETYFDARWKEVMKLEILYYFRNKAVHNGVRNPQIDEVALSEYQKIVMAVLRTISANAYKYKMKSVEEILAWCEQLNSPGDVV